jgi:hypothetical protein
VFMLQMEKFGEAAGLGFEPRLTDPESLSIHPWLFTSVQKTAYSGLILRSCVSHRSPMLTPVTVKFQSNGQECSRFTERESESEITRALRLVSP